MFDLMSVEPLNYGSEKPRAATMREASTYLRWLAQSRGFAVGDDYEMIYTEYVGGAANAGGTVRAILIGRAVEGGTKGAPHYSDGAVCIPIPGYGRQPLATCEILDEAGEVARTMVLPANAKGGIPMDKAQVAEATGLKAVRKVRAKVARAEISPVEASEPVSAPTVHPVPESSLSGCAGDVAPVSAAVAARLDALEAAVSRLSGAAAGSRGDRIARALEAASAPRVDPVAAEAAARQVEAAAARAAAAIKRAWKMRSAMRERADLDRRALLLANGDNRLLHETLQRAEADGGAVRRKLAEMEADRHAQAARADAVEAEAAQLRREVASLRAAAEAEAENTALIRSSRREAINAREVADAQAARWKRKRAQAGGLALAMRRRAAEAAADAEIAVRGLEGLSARLAQRDARIDALELHGDHRPAFGGRALAGVR